MARDRDSSAGSRPIAIESLASDRPGAMMSDLPADEQRRLRLPRGWALSVGAGLVIALAFLIPYFNLSLNKFDWAFRPLGVGPVFLLFLLVWPVNALLRRLRPDLAFTRPELLLMYAMMAICAAFAGEGLYVYVMVNSVQPQYYASPENRWTQILLPNVPPWLQVTSPEAVRWFFEGAPAGAHLPWVEWLAPIWNWSLIAFALYLGLFSLACLIRRDWIESQRLSFPLAVLPIEMTGNGSTAPTAFFRNPYLWAGFALPVGQSLFQMAHSFAPSVPYSSMYWQVGRWFGQSGPMSSLLYTYVYIGFETIGILALLPAEVSLSLWLFFLANRTQVLTFAALGYGQEAVGASLFSPSAFIAYQETGGCFMLALLVLWQSRRSLAAALRSLYGRPGLPPDPLAPLSPRGAAIGLAISAILVGIWSFRAGMELWVVVALMAIFYTFSLATARLVAAGGIYTPAISMAPRDVLVGLTGASAFSPASLTMVTLLQHTFMLQWKVNFLSYTVNDFKLLHVGRVSGRTSLLMLLLAVVLMMAIVPWVNINAAYRHAALNFDTWQFRDSGNWQFGELAASLQSPEGRTPYLTLALVCGAAAMYGLDWLHSRFVWWGLSPIGFIMGGTGAMNSRIWSNAFIAWLLVSLLRRFGGLRLYTTMRPAFVGMALGHFVIIGLRSAIDPLLGLHMQLSPWA